MKVESAVVNTKIIKKPNEKLKKIIRQRYLYMLMAPAIIWVILFCYGPMYGLYMAFVNYVPGGRFILHFFF